MSFLYIFYTVLLVNLIYCFGGYSMVKLKYLSLLFSLFVLTACSKSDKIIENDGGIVDLKEHTQSVQHLEDINEVEISLSSLDDVVISETESLVVIENEYESIETTLSARDVVNNLPVDINIKEKISLDEMVTYDFLDVSISYIPNLLVDTWSEYPDSYITEDGLVYLMHNKEDRQVTVEEIKEKFISDHVLEEDIYVDSLGNKTLVMANFIDETASSNMSYVLDDDEVHLFVLAKVGSSKEEVESDMLSILTSAKFKDDSVEIYWKDKTGKPSFKVQNINGLDVALGDSWEYIPSISSSHFIYKVDNSTNLSINYLNLEDENIRSETLESYIDVVKSTFGEPLELNTLKFNNSDVIWTEFVYRNIEVSGKNVNLGVYIADLETGLLYLEMSTSVDNELQYYNIMGIIDSLNE